ncbi:MAG: diaminopimelate dehydrogenase [Negativibacillus sp.]|nr:diaminopimelate dehydrogenase [Negativibacillus sp.]
MEKIRAVIVGYGNIGQYALEAVQAAKDFELVGVIRHGAQAQQPKELDGICVVDSVEKLPVKPQVALLSLPTRSVEEQAKQYLAQGINTVDSFDIHTKIWELRCSLDAAAKQSGAVSVISAGWDPGSDSVVRTLLEACAPNGITDTNFGPGMSMGHSVAAKGKDGVKAALSMTIPLGTGIHRRNVYLELEDGADFETVKRSILEDDYFKHDETHVMVVPSVEALMDKGHGVNLVRKGVSGMTHNQLFEFNMKINNPALTSQIMVACARATLCQQPGCYVMPQLPVMDLLPGTLEEKIRRLV